MATRVTNVWREDLVEVDPNLRVTKLFVEVLHDTFDPPPPPASLIPIIIANNT